MALTASPGGRPQHGPVALLCRALMLAGGAMLLATALLTAASVLRRWLLGQPIPGDFELVQAGSGLAVFGFLAFGTLRRANILVDSFTSWLPTGLCRVIDAFWNLVWAAAAALLGWRMVLGALDAWRSDTRSMVLSMPLWWAIGLGALALLATALAALRCALQAAEKP
ncbi:TRAP transporter small permease [Teichococcus aestuarii]|uniref:TRAP transporter small permease n=1 Tax=Teichococcus aestuarii TaxID=568898 RepID=UPI003608C235